MAEADRDFVHLLTLLEKVAAGGLPPAEAAARLLQAWHTLPAEAGDVVLDHGRTLRAGFPEAVFAAGKDPAQLVAAFTGLLARQGRALATRCSPQGLAALQAAVPGVQVDARARVAWVSPAPAGEAGAGPGAASWAGPVAVVAAGSSDLPVAEEAALTLEFAGVEVVRVCDVGVAGLHRLLHRLPDVLRGRVVIAVAGMEGALAGVLGGLVPRPVVAVPTSVGYGASFGGVAALLAMLNACSAGIPVVNIDNGFGAAVAAIRILRGLHP